MSAVGSLVFCTDCGDLLDASTGNANTILVCHCCGAQNKGRRKLSILYDFSNDSLADTASSTIETTTKASSFPSLLRQKRSLVQQVKLSDHDNEAKIAVACPECGKDEVRYSAVQLRGADEGSTIFYTCDCGYK